jgi:hypothetical protein
VGDAQANTDGYVRRTEEREIVTSYEEFLDKKTQLGGESGFSPTWIPDYLFDFQKYLVDWNLRKGRAATFADCGLGKTPMSLVWAQNVVQHTNKPVLVATPLAVAHQFVTEGEKFQVETRRSVSGEIGLGAAVIVTNYERLHHFKPNDFSGFVCDESSILKSFDGARRSEITEFMRKMEYRLLATATAAPNDYTELGTSAEALGELGHMDMLMRFFKNDQHTIKPMSYRQKGKDFQALDDKAKWRFKGHAEIPFWRWVCSWACAIRRPSDLGFSDDGFVLPELVERQHVVKANQLASGFLFALPAVGLTEQREERRRTITERCEAAAELTYGTGLPFVSWCHLNTEGDLLAKLSPDAVQVSGADSDDEKEEKFLAFSSGKVRGLITKPKIGAWGLNWQHCNHQTTFPSHSYEQYYQGVRRSYRFGQKLPVNIDIITTEGEMSVLENLQKKSKAADKMFSSLVGQMHQAQTIKRSIDFATTQEEIPWL